MKKLLTEISYTLPTNGPAAFWDFYALNYLWFRIGGGHESMYGGKFHPGKIPSIKRQEIINEVFDRCARKLLKELTIYLFQAAVKEFHNYPSRSEFRSYDDVALRNKLSNYENFAIFADISYEDDDADVFYNRVINNLNAHKISIKDIRKTFADITWENQYGGKIWAKIIDIALEISNKQNTLPLKDVVGYIDKIYDMQHNTGSILNKGKWEVLNTDLDKRHDLQSIKEFIPRVTPVVKALIMNSLPYFDK
jgi:hypothetical protein